MQTIVDLLAHAARLPLLTEVTGGPLQAYKSKSKLYVPGEGAIPLPIDERGMLAVVKSEANITGLDVQESSIARMHLLRSPGIAFPLPEPDSRRMSELGIDASVFRNENPRRVGAAIAVHVNVDLLYGVVDAIVIENGIRMGSSQVASFADRWTTSLDEAEEWIFSLICQTNPSLVSPGPEPNTEAWKTVVLLLGGDSSLPQDWKRRFRLAAGLRKVRLDIQVNPEPAKSRVVRDLRLNPPAGLLVWADWIANPDAYLGPYLAARRGGVAEILGSADRSLPFEEAINELLLHMRVIAPLGGPKVQVGVESVALAWKHAEGLFLEQCGSHIALTENARSMLAGNPYPDCERMFQFFKKLAALAELYYSKQGKLGTRIADFAQAEFGLEIALFDSRLDGIEIEYDGRSHEVGPHVKVDDYKSPDACGRIYFSIDSERYRFIVDHIGLHNYRE